MTSSAQMDLFSSVISDIKTYAGSDPLRPWIKGIRKIHQGLPPHVVTEKLPRFLQKCAETFESHRRYRNDSRYIAVWIQLMDHVKEPRAILRKMEKSEIGMKRAEFYIAYAVYYVKKKRFEDAEKMYHLGVQKSTFNIIYHLGALILGRNIYYNSDKCYSIHHAAFVDAFSAEPPHSLAEPVEELQKSYDGNFRRMKLINSEALEWKNPRLKENAGCAPKTKDLINLKHLLPKIADSGILGKSPAPNACHHGLLVPTVNMKESTDSICNMLKDALEQESISRSSNVGKSKSNHHGHAIQVFVDEDIEEPRDLQNPFVGAFKILADNDVADGDDEEDDGGTSGDCSESEEQLEAHWQTAWPANSEDSMESRTITSDIRF
ncbi:hypothetical protein HPP92_019014 [Vanilla planifolia]|uniref:BUB1 N-terminal domain-containing protein n=1 Tax=Vanilla planifolia TaxID=51239 RepID=A0A835Q830_VANPL|nr:hypothetical protein HPP92_019014 [Vanilla planifolia]